MKLFHLCGTIFFVVFFCSNPIYAQWTSQTIEVNKGWNAIFIEIEPYPSKCVDQFIDKPIRSLWTYDQRFTTVQFVQDPNELEPDTPKWRVYYPPAFDHSFETNLFTLQAGTPYLIEADQAFTWTIVGKPKFVQQKWHPESMNLVGFYVDESNPPMISQWFGNSTAHQPLEVWTLGNDQVWHKISSPNNNLIESGKAYWVNCHGASDYQGPVRIDLTEGTELNYASSLVEHTIEIQREGIDARQITVSSIPSLPVPQNTENLAPLAGITPLQYLGSITQGNKESKAYIDLPAVLNFNPEESIIQRFQLSVDRTQMAPNNNPDALYLSVLVIKDNAGYMRKIGVVSKGRSSTSSSTSGKVVSRQDSNSNSNPNAGLWIGTVALDYVNEPNSDLTETPAEFNFRLILHVDDEGTIRLLNEVTQLWRNASGDETGRYVLLTPTAPASLWQDVDAGDIVPSTLRDGRPFARRISSAMFSLRDENGNPEEPIMALSGEFGIDGSTLKTDFYLEDTDPLNPFHHQYHPQHAYPEGGQAENPLFDWTIHRDITLTFESQPRDGFVLPGAGDTQFFGIYTEELSGIIPTDPSKKAITGLRNKKIKVQGYFRIHRVSKIDVLNDGMRQ